RPDQQQLAVGRYDGALLLLDAKTGKVQAQPLPVKPEPIKVKIPPSKPPRLKGLNPDAGPRGKKLAVTFVVDSPYGVPFMDAVINHPGARTAWVKQGLPGSGRALISLTSPPDTPPGVYQVKLKNEAGESNSLPFTVDLFDATQEIEPNDSPRTG